MSYAIPFNRPCMTGRETEYISEAIDQGHVSGDGPFSKRCHELLEKELGVHKTLLTTSCTHALEMGALLLDLEPGDEVIVPSFAFVSTVNAFVLHGAIPVFCDVREDTLNMDEALLETCVTPRTRAIVPLHYAGVSCEMDSILATAQKHGLTVIEDNAHGLFGRYKGRCLGSMGALGTQSFHETKNLQCGEGGALLINDSGLVDRAEILREKGTNRSRFFRGAVDKYTWTDVGSSYLMSDILAAFLYAQLLHREDIQARRKRIWKHYNEALSDWAASAGIRLPHVPTHCDQTYHMFYMIFPTPASRDRIIDHLKEQGILPAFHYLPLHLSPMGLKFGGQVGDCPVAETVSDCLLRLPLYNDMTNSMQEQVIDAVCCFRSFDDQE
jgi:dTDP-4-amino-4,6-dideoxygalactose transaminase